MLARTMIDKDMIRTKQATLDRAAVELKAHFVGIDATIDALVDYIRIWYIMPDLLTRPLVVNLWGMTGVGKTDLVRRLVSLLDFSDRYCEIELSNTDGTSYHTSVTSILTRNKLSDGKPAIVLFDEIQRFNTIDDEGKPLPQSKFVDFWELLSDGRLAKKERDDLDQHISALLSSQADVKRRKQRGEENVDDNPLVNFWSKQEIGKMLNRDGMLPDALTEQELIGMLMEEKKTKRVHAPVNHSRTLIIIGGNLDSAYSMATQTSETDVDADIFHAFTTKITDVDIKNALTKKFRPEQVARFGNVHLIYPSLKRVHFALLIHREIERSITDVRARFGITLSVDASIERLVYRNGVFPTQGVRPVYSTLGDIYENQLAALLFSALLSDATRIAMRYDEDAKCIVSSVDDTVRAVPYVGRLDKIRESSHEDNVASISVHESGHAVAYMVLTGLVPLQLLSKVAGSYASGFTFPHMVYETRESMIHRIKIYLAGGLAEEAIFGEQHPSIGRGSDRVEATRIALDYVRLYGFDSEFQCTYTLEGAHLMDKSVTDLDVEKMMARLVSETRELLARHAGLLRSLSVALVARGKLTPLEMVQIGAQHAVTAVMKAEGHLKIPPFATTLHALAESAAVASSAPRP